ncbi:MAG TPA: plastocyanin/azurin family copper-binding protein [Pyrinomonadaceae bacterium]|jgi:plastocyanin
MSYRLSRTSALAAAFALSGLMLAGCGGRNEGETAGGPKNANAGQAQAGGARAGAASNAAGGAAAATTAGSQQIEMGDDVFQPALVTVPAGTKVTWVNKGHKAHTVVSNDKLFDSGLVNVGAEFSHTFAAPGTYSYHCAPHAKMVGQIVVQ